MNGRSASLALVNMLVLISVMKSKKKFMNEFSKVEKRLKLHFRVYLAIAARTFHPFPFV